MMMSIMALPARTRPVRVGDLLAAAVPGLGEHLLEREIRAGWTDVVGPEGARRSRPVALRQGVLHVDVDNSPWLSELTLRADDLLTRLRSRHGSAVSAIRCSLGAPSPVPTPRSRPRAAHADPLSPEDERSVESIVAPVSDPALATSLRRLVAKDLIARRRRRDVASPSRREPS
jgi:hypothetical protein